MQNETIDKLKNAGYITVTDDSQGIADKVGISGGVDNFLMNMHVQMISPSLYNLKIGRLMVKVWAFVEINPIQIPNSLNCLCWKCNSYKSYDTEVQITAPWYESDLFVELNVKYPGHYIDKISVGCFEEIDPSSIQPLTLNFTDLIFIGDKKQS